MARLADRVPENVEGDLFVDSSCIDCDLCRQIAPETFAEGASQSYVARQPSTEEDRARALMALVTCPTSSIGTQTKGDVAAAARRYPERIDEEVYFCGFASADSYGASSYLIVRPGGNVLVNSPRAARPLLERIAALGGVRWMFLTHRDDVADHEVFRERFGCERVLHARDVTRGTRGVERRIEGDAPVVLDDDLLVVPVPGHTQGSAALLYRERFLFSGDHLWWWDGLSASHSVCWWSWREQTTSMERLLTHRFVWLLPGHGRRWRAPSEEAMRAELSSLVRRMARQS